MKTYSLYDAKAKLSEIIRAVRERGETVTVTWHGEPVAEIRPVERHEDPAERRIADLESRGVLMPAMTPGTVLPAAVARRKGALERFLKERDE